MKIATAAYPLEWFDRWPDYSAKIHSWVSNAVDQGAELLVFPEYGAMELAALSGAAMAANEQGSIDAVNTHLESANTLFSELSVKHGVHILGPSAPVRSGDITVNRAHFLTPTGGMDHQDKQIMTRFERSPWGIAGAIDGAGPLKLFDTSLGKIGVLICYDSEFPLLGKALSDAGADIILVPSCTETTEGYWRVRIGAMARALEQQCVTVMSSLTGAAPAFYAVEQTIGAGGVFSPMDQGFPHDGVIALGGLGTPGWTVADISLDAIANVRADGNVLNRAHWAEQPPAVAAIAQTRLR
ncbi:MAG: amidohydrolase [Rhodobacterales bacterium]|nr:MAG: amidohydrolase [Rhodobacterales bacterium]